MNNNPYQSPGAAGSKEFGLSVREILAYACIVMALLLAALAVWPFTIMLAQLRIGRNASAPAEGMAYMLFHAASIALMGRGLMKRQAALSIVGVMLAVVWILIGSFG